LAAGSHTVTAGYTGDVNYLPTAPEPLSLTVTSASVPPPTINSGGLVGAAGFVTIVSDGELATIFGTNLATTTVSQPTLPLPTILGGVQVLVNGTAAPLLYVSPTQINFQVPYGTPTGTPVPVIVVLNGISGPAISATFLPAAPAVFTYQRAPGTPGSTLDPVILHTDNTLVTPSDPAEAGQILTIYATGMGPLNNAPANGAAAPLSLLATTIVTPTVTVGSASATVQFSGLTPGFVGLWQINIQLPAMLPAASGSPGSLPLVLSLSGASSAPVNLWVQSLE
jgi:uncharacterized protein (TIGR03437 family)